MPSRTGALIAARHRKQIDAAVLNADAVSLLRIDLVRKFRVEDRAVTRCLGFEPARESPSP